MSLVTVHYESDEIDERTSEPFRWRNSFDEAFAKKHLRKIASGRMRDPLGARWPNTRAWIER